MKGKRAVRDQKHRLSATPEYRVWQTMRHRCTQPTSPAWKDYGGRGITICDEWRDSAAAFVAHIGPRPSPKHEIDRIDNDRGYEPGNVRWATRSENDRNRRSTVWVEYRGERRRLADLRDVLGLSEVTVKDRLDRGWSVERAVDTPARKYDMTKRRVKSSEAA